MQGESHVCGLVKLLELPFSIGGNADRSEDRYKVMAYDTQTCKWHTLPPYSAMSFTNVGWNDSGDVDQLGVWQWTCPFPPMPTPRGLPSARTLVVVAGGIGDGTLSTDEILDVDNKQGPLDHLHQYHGYT